MIVHVVCVFMRRMCKFIINCITKYACQIFQLPLSKQVHQQCLHNYHVHFDPYLICHCLPPFFNWAVSENGDCSKTRDAGCLRSIKLFPSRISGINSSTDLAFDLMLIVNVTVRKLRNSWKRSSENLKMGFPDFWYTHFLILRASPSPPPSVCSHWLGQGDRLDHACNHNDIIVVVVY